MKKNIKILAFENPNSIQIEMYRSIRTNIEYSSIDKKIKVLNVTSATANEGKTTTTCNLAILSTNKNKKVLLMDLDLRKPNVHRAFQLKNVNGVTDLLVEFSNNENVNLNKYIQKVTHPNVSNILHVLPAGTETVNPFEILNSKRLKNLISYLSEHFDEIIIDSPPCGILADGIVTSKLADGTIFIIESGKTKMDLIQKSVTQLKSIGVNILGVILTKMPAKLKTFSYYYSHYYQEPNNNININND